MVEKQRQLRLPVDVTDIYNWGRADKICVKTTSLEVADGNILLNWIKKNPEVNRSFTDHLC